MFVYSVISFPMLRDIKQLDEKITSFFYAMYSANTPQTYDVSNYTTLSNTCKNKLHLLGNLYERYNELHTLVFSDKANINETEVFNEIKLELELLEKH